MNSSIAIGEDTVDFDERHHCEITGVHSKTFVRGREPESFFVSEWGPRFPGLVRGYATTTFVCAGMEPIEGFTNTDGSTGEFARVDSHALFYRIGSVVYRLVRE